MLGKQTSALGKPENAIYWRAVERRDRAFNGVFVYAALSTRIYCRPSCPARRPRRDRVVFFASPQAAQGSGFRACLRCHPEESRSIDRRAQRALETCRYIEKHIEEPLNLNWLAARFHVSPSHLQRSFQQMIGISPRRYADACRTDSLKKLLRSGQPVTQALYEAGYGSSSRLYERSAATLGMTPATYRKGGFGMTINYIIAPCALGRILVGATERGVCTVRLDDSDRALETGLRSEFPGATLQPAHPPLEGWVREILSHLQGRQQQLQVPVDVRATAFQHRVWQALCAIPYGSTRSYKQVARGIGKPEAFRAVARACATNPVAVVVPCHRVVRSGGALGGYRWGLKRKRELLRLEAQEAGRGQHSPFGAR